MDAPLELTILMPCLNESETLAGCITEAMGFLKRSGLTGEVLISDNGSTDGSQQIAVDNGARVVNAPERGYGAALLHGVQEAQGKYIIMGDSDGSYDFGHLDPFIEKLRAGYDLVMGNRFKGGIQPGAMPRKNRLLGNPVLTGIGKIVFTIPAIGDFHCGLRGFSKDAFLRMDLRTTGMEFASEMVVKSSLAKMKITEVPTVLRKDGRSRPPHLRPWRDGWRHLSFLFQYSPRWLFLYPGVILLALGLIGVSMLALRDYGIGTLTLSVNSQHVFAGMFLLGTQAIAFSYFTKAVMIREELLPFDARITEAAKYKDVLVIVGALCFMAGISGVLWGVLEWESLMRGRIDAFYVIRRVIPAITAIVFGGELLLIRLFLSVLSIKTSNHPKREI